MRFIFTNHVRYRIKRRNILEQEVIDAIKYPDKTIKKHDKYYFQKKIKTGTIEICCERTENYIRIITVYWL